MKFRAHDTFFIRKGWLNKGVSQVKKNSSVFISKTQNPMDVFGIGNNMVKALRYWMQVTGLTKEPGKGKRVQEFTDFGKLVRDHDQYIDETGTLLLLHYELASNKDDATAWYFFFNEFTYNEFTKEDFVREIQNFIQMNNEAEVATRSLEDDFACILSTYQSRSKTGTTMSPENNIDCPLGELNLIDVLDKKRKIYRKAIPSKELFPLLPSLTKSASVKSACVIRCFVRLTRLSCLPTRRIWQRKPGKRTPRWHRNPVSYTALLPAS